MSGSSGKPLTDCPSNLKEAIDWILRVAGKDGGGGNDNGPKLAQAITELPEFKEAIKAAAKKLRENSDVNMALALEKLEASGTLGELINKLADGLKGFIGYQGNDGTIGQIIGIAMKPTENNGKPYESRNKAKEDSAGYISYKKGYIWSYPKGMTWQNGWNNPSHAEAKTCARIFLSCIPLYYYGLGFLFLKCQKPEIEGGWSDHSLNGDKDLTYFLRSQGFGREELRDDKKTGSHVVSSALNTFSEFNGAKTTLKNFVEFLSKIGSNLNDAIKGESKSAEKLKEHCIPALFLASSTYFTHKRSINPTQSPQPPSSIRTMLYWLSGLMITPQFGELLDHFSTIVPADFKVAVSGLAGGSGLRILSADDLVGHLVRVCLSCSNVLAAIQGTGGSDNPLLHGVFSNTEHLKYPSVSSALLRNISDYTYALQFQLSFLFRQCRYDCAKAGGWEKCKYGNGVSDDNLQSHLCNNHNSSPLQAFLTDKLPSFNRTIPGSISTHLSECSGVTCHVPMGFNGHLKGDQKTGETIYDTLAYFCGDSKDSLNQFCNKLSCLTKRTPRSLGDLFGFTWQLTGQLFNKTQTLEQLKKTISRNHNNVDDFIAKLTQSLTQVPPQSSPEESGLVKSLQTMARMIPFLYQMFTVKPEEFLPTRLFDLKGYEHKESHANLTSVHNCTNGSTGDNCGPYLSPLAYSTGTTFAPKYASPYLSWVLYLTDDLQSGFQEMLEAFNNMQCQSNSDTTHAPRGNCSCESVVQCGGVLPLLYANGFTFRSAYSLMNNVKRSCQKFHDQLSNVLAEGAPLTKLLETIDAFLYMFRYYFLSNLSTFWTIYIGLILYTFFFLLDTLHLRSHIKLTASQTIPPLVLLTSAKPLPITKLTYIGK
ncbi:variant erythrocyte surface antigen-1 family protein [Babesia caballi]|uniref:Variant erythrocyte surface antigen-1 family protein n=1 Tax=Babesia caballi TaxID=5871 RepID=A0AAV4LYA6_BABCB|nr:variant erythrocyte surface antigen-1 family protein [Babesia caballi]